MEAAERQRKEQVQEGVRAGCTSMDMPFSVPLPPARLYYLLMMSSHHEPIKSIHLSIGSETSDVSLETPKTNPEPCFTNLGGTTHSSQVVS